MANSPFGISSRSDPKSATRLLDKCLGNFLSIVTEGLEGEEQHTESEEEQKRELVLLEDLVIRTKDKRTVKLEPNPIQVKLLDRLCADWRNGHIRIRSLREAILKARQQGCSTIVEALIFLDTINTPNTQSIILAHDTEATVRLFQMVRRFYDHLPRHKKPRTQYNNRREIYFPDIDSYLFVGTAGQTGVGRGGTINNVHATEIPKWPDAEEILTGLLESVPDNGNIFIESTAEGIGNEFHRIYTEAETRENEYRAHFFAWFETPEYRTPLVEPITPDEEEQELVKLYGLDDEQLHWRRRRKKRLRQKFPQEYPATSAEAFLVSGNPYFDRKWLNSRLLEIGSQRLDIPFEVPAEFERLAALTYQPDLDIPLDGRNEPEYLKVFKLPEEGRSYVVSADTALGLNLSGRADYDSGSVWDAETFEQVAHIHGRWDTHIYGIMLAQLGFWYNTALLIIERNTHGFAVINGAMHGASYPVMRPGECYGLYHHEDFDEHKKLKVMRPGWPTTGSSKGFMLDEAATAIAERDLILNAPETIREAMRFVHLKGGKAGGDAGSHDDRVIDMALGATALRMQLRRKPKPTGGKKSVQQSPLTSGPRTLPQQSAPANAAGILMPSPTRQRRPF